MAEMAKAGRSTLLVKGTLLSLAVFAIITAAVFVDPQATFDLVRQQRGALQAWIGENWLLAAGAYVLLYLAAVMLSVPGAVWFTIIGGILFGTLAAALLTLIAASAGAVGQFVAARYLFRDWLRKRTEGALPRMERGFREHAFYYMLVLRLLPLFPFWLVNLVPAFTGMKGRTYFLATVLGMIPGTFVFSALGAGVGTALEYGGRPDPSIIFAPQILLPLVGLAVLALVPVVLHKTGLWRKDD